MDLPHISASLGIVHPLCIERGRNAEAWDEQGRHYVDFIGGIALRRLVTSRKQRFHWRTPAGNPHLTEYRNRRSTTSGYRDFALALSHA